MSDQYLYHYTNAYALKEILLNGKLWLTRSDFLNDRLDGILAKNLLIDAVKIACKSRGELGEKIENLILDQMTMKKFLFVCSLSSKLNDMNMYRLYAPLEGGYCLRFKRDDLLRMKGVSIQEVDYDPTSHKQKIKQLSEKYIKAAESFVSHGITDEELRIQKGTFLNKFPPLMEELLSLQEKFKLNEFEIEREVRLCAAGSTDVKFRTSKFGNLLVPYREIEFAEDTEVTIFNGPNLNTDLALQGLQHLIIQAASSKPHLLINWQHSKHSSLRPD